MSDCKVIQLPTALCELHDLLAQFDGESGRNGKQPSVQLITVVVPVRDEQETLRPLCGGIAEHVPAGYQLEIILIDDGSRDRSWDVIRSLTREKPEQIRGIRLRHGAGKSVALTAGFRASRGDLLLTMDADLQDDPVEIPRFLAKLAEGYDLVSGWKRVRHDPWHKVLPSRVFNRLASYFGGVQLHDHNCGFKCYRAEVTRSLSLYGDMHRMIPSLLGTHGFRCTEIEVRHHPRRAGQSKYGWRRIFRGLSDVLTVGFLRAFRQRPAHAFNLVAGAYLAVSAALSGCVIVRGAPLAEASLWLLGSGMFGALAVSTLLAGLLAELVIRGPLRMDAELPIIDDTGISMGSRATPNAGDELLPAPGRGHVHTFHDAAAATTATWADVPAN